MQNLAEGCYSKNYTLATKAQLKKLPPLKDIYSKKVVIGPDTKLWLGFFKPTGSFAEWYAVAGSPSKASTFEDDWILFGPVKMQNGSNEWEWGEFSLRELESIRLPFLLRIERINGALWKPRKVKDVFDTALTSKWFAKDEG